jgi:hypothetical protein
MGFNNGINKVENPVQYRIRAEHESGNKMLNVTITGKTIEEIHKTFGKYGFVVNRWTKIEG